MGICVEVFSGGGVRVLRDYSVVGAVVVEGAGGVAFYCFGPGVPVDARPLCSTPVVGCVWTVEVFFGGEG